MNIYFKILSYLIAIGVVIGGLAWYGSSRYDEGYAARDLLQAKADRIATGAAIETTKEWQGKVDAATKEGAEREIKISADATAARTSANRLRGELTDLQRKLPELTEQAVRNYANTASIVFGECNAEYTALAERADKIDNDRRTLENAWPR